MTAVALHYTVDGPASAPVLLLGESLGTNLHLWDAQVPLLAREFRVVRYDHRGHGGSPVPAGPYTIDDLGADTLSLLDRLGADRAHLAGTSLGAMVAMWIASRAPQRVDRLVLVCTSARLGPAQMWHERAATVRTHGMAAIADLIVSRWVPADFARTRPDVVADLRTMLLATPAEGYAGCCEAIGAMDLLGDLGRVGAPTLTIAGLNDEATPPAHAQQIVAAIAGARLALVAGAAHLANVSRPGLVGELLADFLGGAS